MASELEEGQPGPAPMRRPRNFGRRRELPTITIERNGKRSEYRLSIRAIVLMAGLVAVFGIGYFAATAYLFLRDDLIALSHSRYARTIENYENQIARLRSSVDSLKSRNLIDRNTLEGKVEILLRRQAVLESNSARLDELLQKARESGVATEWKESKTESPDSADNNALAFRGSADSLRTMPATFPVSLALDAGRGAPEVDELSESFLAAALSKMDDRESRQRRAVGYLGSLAEQRLHKSRKIFADLDLDLKETNTATGGPFVPLTHNGSLEDGMSAVASRFEALELIDSRIAQLPLRRPVADAPISSGFGSRVDPFLGEMAMHSGIDFAARAGTPVLSTGSGTVVEAGWNGGYGKTVVIDHGLGLTSRYAHLRSTNVKVGEKVISGMMIGRIGSTGRSTGPHLHYEVHRHGNADDPARYLKAGRNQG